MIETVPGPTVATHSCPQLHRFFRSADLERYRYSGLGQIASINGNGLTARTFHLQEHASRRQESCCADQRVAGLDEPQHGLGLFVTLGAQSVHGHIRHVVQHHGWPEIGIDYLETRVVEGQTAHVAGKQAVGGRRADLEVLTRYWRNFAPSSAVPPPP